MRRCASFPMGLFQKRDRHRLAHTKSRGIGERWSEFENVSRLGKLAPAQDGIDGAFRRQFATHDEYFASRNFPAAPRSMLGEFCREPVRRPVGFDAAEGDVRGVLPLLAA